MDIRDILDRHRVDYREGGEDRNVRHGWIGMECCFCGAGSGKHHLGYSLGGKFFSCWSCGSHSAVSALAALCRVPWHEAKKLAEGLPEDVGWRGPKKARGRLVVPNGVGPLLPLHRRWLEGRRLDPDELTQLWKVGGIGLADRLAWRIYVPIFHRGEQVSWTTRAASDDVVGAKDWAASPDEEVIHHKDVLFGADLARHAVGVVESTLDAMAIGPGGAATCGVGYTREQLRCVARYPLRVVVLDNEPEAQKRARKMCADLSAFPGKTINVALETGKDPSRAAEWERRELRKMLS